MSLIKIILPIVTLTAIGIGYVLFTPFSTPDCRHYSGEMRMGEEVTTFNFSLSSKTVNLMTTFNQPLQALGMPSDISYQFQILAVTQESDLWRYSLKEPKSGLQQELEISPDGDRYSIRWVNDRANKIVYKCMELDNAEL